MPSPTLRSILADARAKSQADLIAHVREHLPAQPDLTVSVNTLSAEEFAAFRKALAQRLAQVAARDDELLEGTLDSVVGGIAWSGHLLPGIGF